MDRTKRKRLEAAGWTVGSARDFLNLSDDETAFVDFKAALGETLQATRTAQRLSQTDVARRLGSSQSRVAKMEAADPSVSIDLLVRSLFKLGAGADAIARAARARRKIVTKI